MPTCKHAYQNTCMHAHMLIHTQHTCTHRVTGKHTHNTHTCMHIVTCTHMCRTLMYTRANTCTHKHTHAHYCINHFSSKNTRSILVTNSADANYQNTNGSPTKRRHIFADSYRKLKHLGSTEQRY